ADGKVIGARYMMYGGVEFEHYFNDRWGLALFYDVGNAIDDLADSLESGAGFGWRWKSPVGPVRVDLANAVSTEDQEWRLHVNIGPDL
ncbi:MAG: BamA/TamA family outer membrane protein, partial [Gammaproteobacteria bacterium]|nr:BamA/TamA family outer membrane protein [Gammaproteobacteria bacterium]